MYLSQKVVGIREANSVDFVKKIFQSFNERKLVVILKQGAGADIELDIDELIEPELEGGWLEVSQPTISDDLPAQVVFTSGTEGRPKMILLHHKTLANTAIRLNEIMQVDKSIREYVGVPVHYSFGFGRVRAICSVGGKAYIPQDGFNPYEIRKLLESKSINAISAVPTLWRMVLENEDVIGEYGKRVKWIEIGSQFMSAQEKKQMARLFPNANIVQHYGLTEASRSTFLKVSDKNETYLESVGQALNGIEVKINSENRIEIRGNHVCDGIYKDGQFRNVKDENGWFVTKDLGHIVDGHLFYDGRSDDVINSGGIKVNPDELQAKLEKQFNAANQVVVTKYPDKVRGDGFLVAILESSPLDETAIINSLSEILKGYSINAKSSIRAVRLKSFPATNTGKVQRSRITEYYLNNDKGTEERISRASNDEHYLITKFSEVFNGQSITGDSTFIGLGGDSLNYVQITMALESYLGYVPENWENIETRNLVKLKPVKAKLFSDIETSALLRVIAIVAVVLTHSGFTYAGGGTLLLFVLIGYNMGRFKHAEFCENGSMGWFTIYAIKILIPYFVLTVLNFVYIKDINLSTIFLVTNLVELNITKVFPFWFVQVLLQSLLIISIIFAIPSVRKAMLKDPWMPALTLLVIFAAIKLLLPFLWDTDYLRDLVPQRFVLLIWLGYCFSLVSKESHKFVIFLLGLAVAFADSGMRFTMHWLITGSIVLTYLPRLKMPTVLRNPINIIASATYYIFIFNGIAIMFIFKVIGYDLTEVSFLARILVTFVAIIMCIAVWKASIYFDIENRVLSLFSRSATNQYEK